MIYFNNHVNDQEHAEKVTLGLITFPKPTFNHFRLQ